MFLAVETARNATEIDEFVEKPWSKMPGNGKIERLR
jgi:hypothetical protein